MLKRILICSNTFAMSCIACVFSCGFLKPRTIDFLKIFIANKAFPNGAMTSSSWASGGACWNYICWSFLLESVLITYCKFILWETFLYNVNPTCTTCPWWTVQIWSRYGSSSSIRSWKTFRSTTSRLVDRALTVWCSRRRARCCETLSSHWMALKRPGKSSGQSRGTSYL